MATEEQIRELAYAIWEQEGRPQGKDVEHHFVAKQILEEREAAQSRASGLQPEPAAPKARRRSSRGRKL